MINNMSNLQLIQPLSSSNDGSRSTMASAQLNQVIPLIYSEVPHTLSTHAQAVGMQCSDRVLKLAKNDTQVLGAYRNLFSHDYRFFLDMENKEVFLVKDCYSKNNEGFLSLADETLNFTPGKIIEKGNPVHCYKEISPDYIPKIGTNANVVFQVFGDNFEDAITISESFAEKTSHYQEEVIDILVNENEYLVDSIPLVEDIDVDYKSRILAVKKQLNKNFMNSLLGSREDVCYVTDDIFYSRGTIGNIFVYRNVEGGKSHHANIDAIYHKNLANVSDFVTFCSELIRDGNTFNDDMLLLYRRACEYVDGKEFIYNGVVFNGYLIKVDTHRRVATTVGSKLTTMHAGKGLVSQILPDSEMPTNSDGVVMDMIINPMSVIGRQNLGQINEVIINNCMFAMRDILLSRPENDMEVLNDFIDHIVLDPLVNQAIKQYYTTDKEKFLAEIEDINNLVTPINPDYKPRREHYAMLMKKYGIRNMKEFTVNGEPVENKLTTGSLYVLKLRHEPELKTSYTSANKINVGSSQPVKDNRFQKNKSPASYNPSACGEMELMTLLLEPDKHILRELIFIKSNNGPVAENFMKSQLMGVKDPSQVDLIGDTELVHNGIRKLRHYCHVLGMDIR